MIKLQRTFLCQRLSSITEGNDSPHQRSFKKSSAAAECVLNGSLLVSTGARTSPASHLLAICWQSVLNFDHKWTKQLPHKNKFSFIITCLENKHTTGRCLNNRYPQFLFLKQYDYRLSFFVGMQTLQHISI